jgi:hypothetical protein
MKRLSYLSKKEKNRATNKRRMKGTRPFERRDSDRSGDQKALSLHSFSDFEDFFYSAGADSASETTYSDAIYSPLITRWIWNF